MANGFDPDPPECFSQVMGASMSDACAAQAKALAAKSEQAMADGDAIGAFEAARKADEATMMSLYYGGFRRLVR